MIEFKRAGDAMVFECPAFKVEIIASGAERIGVNPDRNIAGSDEMMALLTDAFKILDMMIEHKARQTRDLKFTEMNFKVNVDTKDAEEAIRRLTEESSGDGVPSRAFIKLEGI